MIAFLNMRLIYMGHPLKLDLKGISFESFMAFQIVSIIRELHLGNVS